MRFLHRFAIFALAGAFAAPVLFQTKIAIADNPAKVGGDEITAQQQQTVRDGLKWLADRQNVLNRDEAFNVSGYNNNVGVTALAGMAFLQAGNLPGHGKYGRELQNCLDFVLQSCQLSGLIGPARLLSEEMYDHGLATLFLAEVYGLTGDETVKDKLRAAVHLIECTQNSEGGWRYQPAPFDADVSVTTFQVIALCTARNVGIRVDSAVIDRAIKYIQLCQIDDGGFTYMPSTKDSAMPRSAGAVCALYAGSGDAAAIDRGLTYIKRSTGGPLYEGHFFYGYYYAAQAAFFAGGDYWNEFYPAVRDDLILRRLGDHWSGDYSEDYATSMALLILQMPNRRHLEGELQHMLDGLAESTDKAQPNMQGEAELRLIKRYQQYLNERTLRAAKKTVKDATEVQALRESQEAIRGVFDRLIQKITSGKQKLGPPPDFENELPADAKRRDLDDAGANGGRTPDMVVDSKSVVERVQLTGDRMAQSSRLLASNGSGTVTQEIQKRIVFDLGQLIESSRQTRLSTELAWAANGFDRFGEIQTAINAVRDLRDRQVKLAGEFRQVNRDNLGIKPEDLSDAARKRNNELAQEQQDLGTQTGEALEQIDALAKKLDPFDLVTEALKRAAEQGRSQALATTQRDAAENMRQNRQAAAAFGQRNVEFGLDQIVNILRDGRRKHLEALNRRLSELQKSIDALMEQQTGRLIEGVLLDVKRQADAAASQARQDMENNLCDELREAYIGLLKAQQEIGLDMLRVDSANRAANADLPRGLSLTLAQLPERQQKLIIAVEGIGERLKRLNHTADNSNNDDLLNSMRQVGDSLAKPDTHLAARVAEAAVEARIQRMIDSLGQRIHDSPSRRGDRR